MFVCVKYYKSFGGYGGADYTYETDLPLKVGDLVIAPTMKEMRQRGMVVRVNVPRPTFQCRKIEEYDMTESGCETGR